MSVPCQQLMRTAARVDELTQEEYDEIAAWFSGAIHRYRPSCADPAKGGNFDLARYTAHPEEYWSLWKKYAKRYPRVRICPPIGRGFTIRRTTPDMKTSRSIRSYSNPQPMCICCWR